MSTVIDMHVDQAPSGMRARKRLTTRQALGLAALRLAVERGPANVRREDIAAAVDVSPRTFSNYFSSKEEAIVWLAVERSLAAAVSLRSRPAGESLGKAIIAALSEQYVDRIPTKDWVDQVKLIVAAPEVQGAYLKACAEMESSLAEAIAERIGTAPDAGLRARVLAAAACGAERAAISYWLDAKSTVPLAALVHRALTEVIR
jgi:AcrR family transcriptional regulator